MDSSRDSWGPAKGLGYSRCSAMWLWIQRWATLTRNQFLPFLLARPLNFSSFISVLLEFCLLNDSWVRSQRWFFQKPDPICSFLSTLNSGKLLHQVLLWAHAGHWGYSSRSDMLLPKELTDGVRSIKEQGKGPSLRAGKSDFQPSAATTEKSLDIFKPQIFPSVKWGPLEQSICFTSRSDQGWERALETTAPERWEGSMVTCRLF